VQVIARTEGGIVVSGNDSGRRFLPDGQDLSVPWRTAAHSCHDEA
jgi:hypothetical protein